MATMRLLSLLMLATLPAACGVPKNTHGKVLDQLTATRAELEASRERRQILERQNQELSRELVAARAEPEPAAESKASDPELMERLRPLAEAGKLSVSQAEGRTAIALSAGGLFDGDGGELTAEGKAVIDEVLAVLVDFRDRSIRVAGRAGDWRVAAGRSVKVVGYMVEKGFAAEKLGVEGTIGSESLELVVFAL